MKHIIYCVLLLAAIRAHAQNSEVITIGKADSIYSNILHEKRKVWVSMPDTTSPDGRFYPQRYPVVYLLDGDENNFAMAAVLLRQMGGGSGNMGFPAMILVGIPNTNRTRDLTPMRGDASPALDSMSAAQSGGGENFISFMEKELIPHIDSAYPTAPYRVLIGHSFGGLMAMHILINHTQLFNAYLASDPSMWWANQVLLKQAKQVLQKNTFKGRNLFLAMANTMQNDMDTIQVKRDTSFTTLHIRSIMQLGHYLKANRQNGLQFNWKYYPDYGHDGVDLPSEFDGLPSLFKFYGYDFPYGEFFNPAYKGDTLLAMHYAAVSRQMGYTVSPPEQFISVVCHQLTDMKQFNRAYYFLQMDIDNYPKSAHAYADMAMYYEARADRQKAIEYYKKALALDSDAAVQEELDKLLKAQ